MFNARKMLMNGQMSQFANVLRMQNSRVQNVNRLVQMPQVRYYGPPSGAETIRSVREVTSVDADKRINFTPGSAQDTLTESEEPRFLE